MTLCRRHFVQGGLAAAAAATVPAALHRARAQGPTPARNLILVLNFGGWDTTTALDPKPGRPLVDVTEGEIVRYGETEIWSHASRPSVDRFFERWGERTAVINGVQVRSFVHTDCVKRMMTGGPSETTPDMGAITAWELGRELPVPYLALGSQARSGSLAAITGRTGTTNQLVAIVDPESAYGDLLTAVPDPGLVPTEAQRGHVDAFLRASAARLEATRGQRGYNRRRVEDFVASLGRADRLGEFVRSGSNLGERDYTLDINVQIPLAIRALQDGLSHTVLMQTGYSWDTHTGNAPQSAYHEGLFASLNDLTAQLEDGGLLDGTLVMVLSEMGRTPKLNNQNGKDHWPVTSCMMLGAGVRGGRTYGGTDDELSARSLDLQTGEVTDGPEAKQLQTSNLVAGVLEHVGVDPEGYLPRVEAFRAFRA